MVFFFYWLVKEQNSMQYYVVSLHLEQFLIVLILKQLEIKLSSIWLERHRKFMKYEMFLLTVFNLLCPVLLMVCCYTHPFHTSLQVIRLKLDTLSMKRWVILSRVRKIIIVNFSLPMENVGQTMECKGKWQCKKCIWWVPTGCSLYEQNKFF